MPVKRTPPLSPGLSLVGVGPGDPSLLTLAALEAISNATLIAYPIAKEGAVSMAFEIASEWIGEGKKLLPLLFPMVLEDGPRKQALKSAGEQISLAVEKGEIVVFLCEGDVSMYATSSHLLLYMKDHYPKCPLQLIPGISSISAAAAEAQLPLALQKDQLLILPAPNSPDELAKLLDQNHLSRRTIVLLKIGKRWSWIRPLLSERRLLSKALFAQKIGWEDSKLKKAYEVNSLEKPYFSLLIIR